MHFRLTLGCTPTIEQIEGTIFSQQVGQASHIFAGLVIVGDKLEVLDECGFGGRGWGVLEHEFAFAGDDTLDFLFAFLLADADSFVIESRVVFHAVPDVLSTICK